MQQVLSFIASFIACFILLVIAPLKMHGQNVFIDLRLICADAEVARQTPGYDLKVVVE